VPYRRYRSSGGLEIWVGRGAASNDALTFRHAAPHDVWLHARDAAGAHVVLRWPHDELPPARDLEEAAMLAAWHSKMRSSALVPVDWTRRKYVRKVRKGAPGLVTVQRAQTIFARPHADVERALRAL
jgi:predicted ribosome quality control (RQC) complex YloA/Tae2 family protein